MKTEGYFETSAPIYEGTKRHIPQDCVNVNGILQNVSVHLKYHALKTQMDMEIKFCTFFMSMLEASQRRENLS
jgi:hypothetical protein